MKRKLNRKEDAAALCREIERNIRLFTAQCVRDEYTDTEQAWELLHDCRGRARRAREILRGTS